MRGKVEDVEGILAAIPEAVKWRDPHGNTPLILACQVAKKSQQTDLSYFCPPFLCGAKH